MYASTHCLNINHSKITNTNNYILHIKNVWLRYQIDQKVGHNVYNLCLSPLWMYRYVLWLWIKLWICINFIRLFLLSE